MFKPIVTDPPDVNDLFSRNQYNNSILAQKVREEARALLLESKSNELLDNDDLAELWSILEKYQIPGPDRGKSYITYPDFLKAKTEVCSKAKRYFTATNFAKLCHGDRFSRVNILNFFNYVMKTVWLQQTRIGISLYDVSGEGYLREADLENYISELIPSLCKLAGVDEAFKTFYVCTATRKFFFFLDPMRAGRVRICDILACGFLDSILELREPTTTLDRLEANWFSLESARRVYASYLRLDTDQNGMLSRKELAEYNNGSLTDVFLDRVFQECLTYEGEIDYKIYLDFVLAMENRGEPQAIAFLFRIIDLSGRGRLCCQTLEYYFAAVQSRLGDGYGVPRFTDVLNEIFDMVRPRNPDFITLDDLLRSDAISRFWTKWFLGKRSTAQQSPLFEHTTRDLMMSGFCSHMHVLWNPLRFRYLREVDRLNALEEKKSTELFSS